MIVNSVFSSTSTSAAAAITIVPPALAEASTLNVSSIFVTNSEASNKVKVLNLQRFDRFFLT
jgi:hypothetical protein